jgi:hypothetical protein
MLDAFDDDNDDHDGQVGRLEAGSSGEAVSSRADMSN